MKSNNIKYLLLLFALLVAGFIVMTILRKYESRSNIEYVNVRQIPSDVERYINKYTYQQNVNGLDINISGNQVIYRGKKMLGLRSNLVKVTEFDTLSGTIKSQQVLVDFSASEAEWNFGETKPLILKKGVLISINKKPISGVDRAHIYLDKGILEVFGVHNKIINLK
jgi:hypothetical protein